MRSMIKILYYLIMKKEQYKCYIVEDLKPPFNGGFKSVNQ